jgi:hypothetical protein
MTESEYTTGRFHDGEGWRVSLLREGRTRLHITCITDTGVAHSVVPRDEMRHIQPVLYKGAPYPLTRMVRKFREVGRERGITEAAKEELARASA